jgi:hypothetical protein
MQNTSKPAMWLHSGYSKSSYSVTYAMSSFAKRTTFGSFQPSFLALPSQRPPGALPDTRLFYTLTRDLGFNPSILPIKEGRTHDPQLSEPQAPNPSQLLR